MSLRAEALRLALRHFAKGKGDKPPDITAIRRSLARVAHFIPNPPRDTRVTRITANGVSGVQVATPRSHGDRHILYLHGGAYAYGSATLYRDFIWRLADVAQSTVLCIDYRLAPEHPFPAAVDDAAQACRWLLDQGVDPRRLAIMGDSAGGGLAFGSLLRMRDNGDPLPAAVVALSPWTDLSLSGESVQRNARADPMLNAGQARHLARWYLGNADARHPYASPQFGDHTGLPPALIQVGHDEILHDDAANMAENLRRAGCVVELDVWPRMPHVWQLYVALLPEARQALDRIGRFVRQHTGTL
jgi:acetyl esterase/lipase